MKTSDSTMDLSAVKTQSKLLRFGWFGFRPKCMQFLNTSKWFLFFVSMYFFTQSIVVNGVYSVSVTTIEKRYGYSSSMTGALTSCYDVAALLLTPLVSYLGARRRKPKWCGLGLLVMGTGFFIFILPHIFSEKYLVGQSSSDESILCNINDTIAGTSPQCRQSQSTLGYYMLFIVGMLVIGSGSTPMWNLGTAFIDENVKAKTSPMYIGIFSCAGVIGAGVGFVLGAFFLSMYVDVGTQTSLTPKSEEWVGAWWLGFIVCSVLAVLWSVWLIGFPKELPATQELKKQNFIGNNNRATDQEVNYVKLKDLPKASKSLFSKIPYVSVTLGVCVEGFLVSAFTVFMPKVIQQQFQYSPSTVSLLMGLVVIPAALLGNFLGAYICKRLRLHLRGAAKMAYMVSALSLLSGCLLFLNCDTPSIAGINGSYLNESSSLLTSSCNSKCACSTLDFKPVCASGVTYFSPCYAGCQTQFTNGSLNDCACLARGTDVTVGICTPDCGLKPLFYLIAYFLVVFSTFMSATPATVATLRCVPNDQRAYALGIQSSLLRILGTIPGPIVVGTLIDMTCTLWNEGCKGKGNCLQYDNRSLSTVVLVTGLITKIIIITSYFITYIFSPKDQADHNGVLGKRKEITVHCGSLRELCEDCDRETDL